MHYNIRNLLLVPAMVFLLASCIREVPESIRTLSWATSNYEKLVDASNPWFADLGAFDSPQTKADESMQDLRALSSLLDFSEKTTVTISGRNFTQIPFLSNAGRQFFCEASDVTMPEKISLDSVFVAKKYLIKSGDGGEMLEYVVTMLVRWNYCEEYGYENISYLSRPNFSGYIVFSDPDCTYNYISYYDNGRLYKAEFESFQDSRNAAGTSHTKNIFAFSLASTKVKGVVTVHGGQIVDSICSAEAAKRVTTEGERPDDDPTEYIGSGLGGGFAGEDGPGYKGKGGGRGAGSEGSSSVDSSSTSTEEEDDETKKAVKAEATRLENKLKNRPVTGGEDRHKVQLKKLINDFSIAAAKGSVEDGVDVLSKLFDCIETEVIEFVITTEAVDATTKVKHIKNSSTLTQLTVTLPIDVLGNKKCFGHELFHCMQYSDGNNVLKNGVLSWRRGDLEFEAFLFDAWMMKMEIIGAEFDVTDAMNYVNNPCDKTFGPAFSSYRRVRYKYTLDEYPITEGMPHTERVKHLNF